MERSDQGSRRSDQGSRRSDQGSRHSDQGSRHSDQGSRHSDQGSGHSDKGSRHSDDPLKLFERLPVASVSDAEIEEMVNRVRLLREFRESQEFRNAAERESRARVWRRLALPVAAALLLLAVALPRITDWPGDERSGRRGVGAGEVSAARLFAADTLSADTFSSTLAGQRAHALLGRALASLPLVEEIDASSSPVVYQMTQGDLDLVMILGEGLDL